MTSQTEGAGRGMALSMPQDVPDVAARIQNEGERIPVEKNGRTVAVLVPVSDLAALEALEERLDLLDAPGRAGRLPGPRRYQVGRLEGGAFVTPWRPII